MNSFEGSPIPWTSAKELFQESNYRDIKADKMDFKSEPTFNLGRVLDPNAQKTAVDQAGA